MMDEEIGKELFVDAFGHCFLCLKNTEESYTENYEPKIGSLQSLSYYLKMDKTKVFNERADIPPKLLSLVEKSKLNAELCENCFELNENFSALYKQFECIKMELTLCLNTIQQRLNTAKNNEDELFLKSAKIDFLLDSEKVNIVKRMRDEAMEKCTKKLISTDFPRVKLTKLSSCYVSRYEEKAKIVKPFSLEEKDLFIHPYPSLSCLPESSEPILLQTDENSDLTNYKNALSIIGQDLEASTPPSFKIDSVLENKPKIEEITIESDDSDMEASQEEEENDTAHDLVGVQNSGDVEAGPSLVTNDDTTNNMVIDIDITTMLTSYLSPPITSSHRLPSSSSVSTINPHLQEQIPLQNQQKPSQSKSTTSTSIPIQVKTVERQQQRKFDCISCKESFFEVKHLTHHRKLCHPIPPIQRKTITQEAANQKPQQNTCKICPKSCCNMSALYQHYKTTHLMYLCCNCQSLFRNAIELQNHVRHCLGLSVF